MMQSSGSKTPGKNTRSFNAAMEQPHHIEQKEFDDEDVIDGDEIP